MREAEPLARRAPRPRRLDRRPRRPRRHRAGRRGRRAAPRRPPDRRAGARRSACRSVGHSRRLVGRHHEVDPERPGRGDEVGGTVGGGRHQEDDRRHGPIMVAHERPVLTITDEARGKILEVRADEDEPDTLALCVEVAGQPGRRVHVQHGVPPRRRPVTPTSSSATTTSRSSSPARAPTACAAATLDIGPGGMVMQNPNRPAAVGRGSVVGRRRHGALQRRRAER